jgi:two-component system sensor histidine kinase YesM
MADGGEYKVKKMHVGIRFLSHRVAVFIIALFVLLIAVLAACTRLVMVQNVSLTPLLVFAAAIPTLLLIGWFWIVKPYDAGKEKMWRFLDGYLSLDAAVDPNEVMLTPFTYLELDRVNKILRSSQTVNLNKRQAQYLALQNQINPHFLYNTLDGIRSEALIAGVENVAEMTEALATFFRYTISKVENLVTVEEELDNCKTYFKIQQYRFGDRIQLRVETDADDDIMHCLLPKLTLQPILENSIIHGTELKIGTGVSTIHLEKTQSRLLVRISDDGVGIDRNTLEDLNRKLGKSGEQMASTDQERKGGIALYNVNNRIHLLFGGEYGLHVYSIKNVGTDVEITIPIITSEREIKEGARYATGSSSDGARDL